MSSQPGAGQARSGQAAWPVLSGVVPPLAAAHVPRHETSSGVTASMAAGETAVLVPAGGTAGGTWGELGGTGKTQLAAALARSLLEARALDLLPWVNATGRDAVVTAYAQAIHDADGPLHGKGSLHGEDPLHGEGPEEAAPAFLAWLAETERAWLVVFDDLSDPGVLEGLWPHGPQGRVLVTTQNAGTAAQAPRPSTAEVGVFSPREALEYLSARLQADPGQLDGALDLADRLGFLPISLGQAGAFMAETGLNCRQYLDRIADLGGALAASPADGRSRAAAPTLSLAAAPADKRPRSVTPTWSLSAALAGQLPPAGLAGPALALAAVLDPNGIPGVVFISQAACVYFTGCLGAGPVDEAQARAAMYNLGRAGLVTIDASSAARTVRVHARVQDAVLERLAAAERDEAARAAAAALLEAWSCDATPPFEQALRDSTARLHRLAREVLWAPECHPVLLRAGQSLESGGLARLATAHWRSMLDTGQQLLRPGHPYTAQARDRLAAAYEATGQPRRCHRPARARAG